MSAYDDAAAKAVTQVLTQLFASHPVLSDHSVAEKLAGLLNSDNERVVLGAIKMWSVLRQMKPREDEETAPSTMEEILRAETQPAAPPPDEESVIWLDVPPASGPARGGRHVAH